METQNQPEPVKRGPGRPPKEPTTTTTPPPPPPAPAKPVVVAKAEPKSNQSLQDFQAIIDVAPKEWLPSMMVRLSKKCIEKGVFPNGPKMAESIIAAAKVK